MVYTASLALPVSAALGKKAMQSNLNKICDLISLDPDTSKMDVVILGPNDLIGPKLTKVKSALKTAHPDVCVIYVYSKDAEGSLIEIDNKMQGKKINKGLINDAFEKFVGEHKIRQGKQQVTSADFEVLEGSEELTSSAQAPISKDPGVKQKKERLPLPGFKRKAIRPEGAGVPDENVNATTVDYTDDDFDDQVDGIRINLNGELIEERKKKRRANNEELPSLELEGVFNKDQTDTTADEKVEEPTVDLSQLFTGNNTGSEEIDTPGVDMNTVTPMPSFGTPMPQEDDRAIEANTLPTLEETIANTNNYEDWVLLREKLNHDSITRALIQENSEFVGLINMIDVLDKRIESVWRDTTLSPEEKFNKIKGIGLEKSALRASTNSLTTEKVISVISTIIRSAQVTVEEKLQSIDNSLYKIASDGAKLADTHAIDQVIEERTKVQMDLLSSARDIVDLYGRVEKLVVEEIKELDAKLPSASAFVNDMVKPIGTKIFTPKNTSVLANKLMKALQENKIIASEVEGHIQAIISQFFSLCEMDEEIIHYLQNSLEMLKANHVEEVVIVDTLIKNTLRIYVGADNTGRSATAITWCGILSRRQNSLLIDLTGRSKFREYGITPVSLDEFMSTRIEQQFLCVESNHILDADELQSLVDELKLRLNYYPYVNVIMAPEDIHGLNQLSEDAICVHYITDCSTSSISVMKDIIRDHTTRNVARKLVTIDAPVSPLMIADSLNVDSTITKLITLPSVPAIKACSLRHDKPFEFSDVVKSFEEAFR